MAAPRPTSLRLGTAFGCAAAYTLVMLVSMAAPRPTSLRRVLARVNGDKVEWARFNGRSAAHIVATQGRQGRLDQGDRFNGRSAAHIVA
ncbi:MAG TPA: hypothetical protein VD866_02900, partial [Urbifossiella sp.]|nr:hypothetical protein [Urbifossiella sp.]